MLTMLANRSFPLMLLFATLLMTQSSMIKADSLRVVEMKTKLRLEGDHPHLKLAIENSSGHSVPAQIQLELLDPDSLVRSAVSQDAVLTMGLNVVDVPTPNLLAKFSQVEGEWPWYRLRYRVTPARVYPALDSTVGLVSLSEITDTLFELRAATPHYLREGTRCRVHVFARHPVSSRPVRAVTVSGKLKVEDDSGEKVLTASGTTNASGYAALDFDLPKNLQDSDTSLIVTGRRSGLVKQLTEDVELQDRSRILVSTDKPIYQPGQCLRIRILAFDNSRKAMATTDLNVIVRDEESTTVFRKGVTTSRFGQADTEWAIPENVRLGQYSIEIERNDSSLINTRAVETVRISRYELPNFAVTVKPDRSYYLPGQNAQVEVRADYLFGQPVKHAHARIVRELERRWNYREQKWDTKEAEKYEGDVDEKGQFLASIDLADAHEDLSDDDYERFQDLHYAAFITDSTTGRTEQRRFDLRLSKDSIHIYVDPGRDRQTHNLPIEFYLSTFYPDGTPASCEVRIAEKVEPPSSTNRNVEAGDQWLKTIKTNRYGAAKVTGLRASGLSLEGQDEVALVFRAFDGRGRQGKQAYSFWLSHHPVVRVNTNKTLYRKGDPLEVQIESSLANNRVVLDLLREERVVFTKVIRLRKGKAFCVIPFQLELQDELTLSAYPVDSSSEGYEAPSGWHRVLYPRDRELRLDLILGKKSYQPGKEASAAFRVRTPTGLPTESVLGVLVLDKAVEERARTDQEFSSAYGFYGAFSSLMGFTGQFAGISRQELDRLNLSQPVPQDLDLAAEVLLNQSYYGFPPRLSEEETEKDAYKIFQKTIVGQLEPVKSALQKRFEFTAKNPTDEASLRRFLGEDGQNFDEIRDPWGNRYAAVFSIDRQMDVLEFRSSGPDKCAGTADDFTAARLSWPYFRSFGEAMNHAVEEYYTRTGSFIRDSATLKEELQRTGFRLDTWRDRWGQPYRFDFGIQQTLYTITVRSSGPNQAFEPPGASTSDDFPLWTSSTDYTQQLRRQIDTALTGYFRREGKFPENDAQIWEALNASGIERASIRDPWGHCYYPTFKADYRYSDRYFIKSYSQYLQDSRQHNEFTPITRLIRYVVLRSVGEDGEEGTPDDFDVATFSRIIAEQSSQDAVPQFPQSGILLQGLSGAIRGVVLDPSSAVIPGAIVKATRESTSQVFTAKSDDEGHYLLRNLPSGFYEVRCETPGFRIATVTHVPVQSSNVTELNFTLALGAVTQTVEVSTGVPALATAETAQLAQKQESVTLKLPVQTSTPRLREYFPETLVWQPVLETGRDGRAHVKFKLADNITTWKMAVVASTIDGQIGMAEKEFLAFQPFFIEHNPPPVLTEGDEINLPVVLRNYLDKEQAFSLEMKPEKWFTLLDSPKRESVVKPGEASREFFRFRTVASIKDGRQRLTAIGAQASDAIEKPVAVHPDGEEVAQSVTQIFKDRASLEIEVPTQAIPHTVRGDLKLYPDLMAHVAESIEAILQRPYGCGEQTISSTYPSLLMLRYAKQLGQPSTPLTKKASRYLQAGYERLLGYRTDDGGFSYWGRGKADVALTAYALRFLNDARDLIPVGEEIIQAAYEWLARQQNANGGWLVLDWQQKEDPNRTLNLTAMVARSLSGLPAPSSAGKLAPMNAHDALPRALRYLRDRTAAISEPYAMASLALAAIQSREREEAELTLDRLRSMTRQEGAASYWNLETNTPFYGWGIAGRLETTALVLQALIRSQKVHLESKGDLSSNQPDMKQTENENLIQRALVFLLHNKDRYGVWHSTQATINVLDALMGVLGSGAPGSGAVVSAEVFVNGKPTSTIMLSTDNQPSNPIQIDVSAYLVSGRNQIEIRSGPGAPMASAQLVESHYAPWKGESPPSEKKPGSPRSSGPLRLAVRFDKNEAKVADEIVCKVEAERIGFRGYGMLLAEIGLPPGSEVDRASLEKAMHADGWDLSRYDILPDRLIVYLWPRAGGTAFEFKFRPRFGMRAKTTRSVLYDYYNPEARTVVKPTDFVVQ